MYKRKIVKKMIAYYAWTDTQLINCVNLKVNQHAGEDGVLFVLKLERISDALLDVIIKDKCFVDIKVVPCKYVANSRNAIARTLKIDTVLEQKRLRLHYRKCFANAVGDTVYSRLVTAGFWAETSFLIESLIKNNEGMVIDFVEEGSRHGSELYSYTLDGKIHIKVLRWFYDGYMVKRWKKICEHAFFYSPERFDGEDHMECYEYSPLIPVDDRNPKVKKVLLSAVEDICIEEYQIRSVIILEDLYGVDLESMVQKVADLVDSSKIIVKTHPFGKIVKKKIANIFYDERQYIFEGLLMQIPLEDKTIICSISSIPKNIRYMLKKQCRFIMTNGFRGLEDLEQRM